MDVITERQISRIPAASAPDAPTSSRLVYRWQEQDPGERAGRRAEPPPHLSRSRGKGLIERRGKLGDPPPSRPVLGQDDQPRDGSDAPTSVRRELRGDTHLPIDTCKRRLDVGHNGLDLDDEECPVNGVPREDIDRSSLAEVVERRFREDLPATLGEQRDNLVDETRMGGVEQSIEVFAVPIQPHGDAGIQALADPLQATDRQAPHPACLGSRDRSL